MTVPPREAASGSKELCRSRFGLVQHCNSWRSQAASRHVSAWRTNKSLQAECSSRGVVVVQTWVQLYKESDALRTAAAGGGRSGEGRTNCTNSEAVQKPIYIPHMHHRCIRDDEQAKTARRKQASLRERQPSEGNGSLHIGYSTCRGCTSASGLHILSEITLFFSRPSACHRSHHLRSRSM